MSEGKVRPTPCSACGAQPNEPCLSPEGRTTRMHPARERAAAGLPVRHGPARRMTKWSGARIVEASSVCVCGWMSPLAPSVVESDALRREHIEAAQ